MKDKINQPEKTSKKRRSLKREHCDVCGTPMTVNMYRKYCGFCKKCYKLYFED